jgi:hypothetical protein
MAGNEEQERIAYYQSREQVGPYLDKLYSFFPGQPTLPNNETANKAIYINNGLGPGAKIINGIKPYVPPALPCDDVIITSLVGNFVDPALFLNILWNLLPGDIITLFNTSTGQVLTPVAVSPIVGGLEVEFDMTLPPATAGSWSLKIARAENLDCFAVRSNAFQLISAVCALSVTGIGPPASPVSPPGPPGFPGGVGFFIELTGTGFLTGALTIEVINNFFPFNTLVGYGILVINDANLTFLFDGSGVTGLYGVRVSLTADPTCFGEIGFGGPPGIALVAV